MFQTTLKIEGMMCGMCEAHINDAIRKNLVIRKVASFHLKGETIVISDDPLDMDSLKKAIDETGYKLISYSCTSYETNDKFHLFKRKL